MVNSATEYKYSDLVHTSIRFQDWLYDFEKLILFARIIEGNKCEIFPGIFIQIEKRNWVKLILDIFLKRDSRIVTFEIYNAHDIFSVGESTLTKEGATDIVDTGIKYIDPNSIEYPNSVLGGKCGGCQVVRYFEKYFRTGYCNFRILTDSDILELSENMDFFDTICKDSDCYKTYLKILEEGYKSDLKSRDMVSVYMYKDTRIVGEGKHRICAMKRHGYNSKIPVKAYVANCDNSLAIDALNYDVNKELDEYYNIFRKIGMEREDVLQYLEDSNANLCEILIPYVEEVRDNELFGEDENYF